MTSISAFARQADEHKSAFSEAHALRERMRNVALGDKREKDSVTILARCVHVVGDAFAHGRHA